MLALLLLSGGGKGKGHWGGMAGNHSLRFRGSSASTETNRSMVKKRNNAGKTKTRYPDKYKEVD